MVKFRSFFCLYLVSFSTLFSSSSKIFLLVSPPPHSFFLYSFFLYSFFLLLFLLSPSSALPSWTLKASSSTYRCTWWLIDQTLFLSSPMKFAPISACLTSTWTHVLTLSSWTHISALSSWTTSWSLSPPLLSLRIICWCWWWEWAWVWGWGWGAWWGGRTLPPAPSRGFPSWSETPLPPQFLISLSLYLGWVCCIFFWIFDKFEKG